MDQSDSMSRVDEFFEARGTLTGVGVGGDPGTFRKASRVWGALRLVVLGGPRVTEVGIAIVEVTAIARNRSLLKLVSSTIQRAKSMGGPRVWGWGGQSCGLGGPYVAEDGIASMDVRVIARNGSL